MKRRDLLAFAGLLIMLTASFAPIAQAPVPGSDLYVTMGGSVYNPLFLYVNNVLPNSRFGLALPMLAPFVTRDPYLKPNHLIEEIFFAPPVDVNNDTIPDIIPIEKIMMVPIQHHVWVDFRGTYHRFTLMPLAPGGGVIFINPQMPGDVDCYTMGNDTGVYWDASSPLAGQFAAPSGGHFKYLLGDFSPPMAARFPSAGLDGLPGTGLWGDPADGFGDGVPDPKGSSILMLPVLFYGEEWNGTAWEPLLNVPMPLVFTTGVTQASVNQPGSNLHGAVLTETGMPWECMSECAPWDDPKAFIKVIYACAWSNMLYSLSPDYDGDCTPDYEGFPDPIPPATGMYYTVDSVYSFVEKKVRADVVIMDINCDQEVDIYDLVIAGVAFGAEDEGIGDDLIPFTADDMPVADPNYDPRADLDCDGHITIMDVLAIAMDFGEKITC